MAKRIFDISKEFGLHPKVVLAKARELGIAQAKVVSSLLDDNDTARLEKELLKASSQQMKPSLKNCRLGALFWPGCVRTQNDGEHIFPDELKIHLERLGLKPDTRTNGPAVNSFQAAGGKKPIWGNEGWHIHHIFDGTEGSPHAVRDGNHFTHSAGLVAAHPVAHHLAHHSNLLKWLLWREAFLRFGFDLSGNFVDA